MKLRKTIALSVALLACFGATRAETLPRNILDQLPPGYAVLSMMRGQLNDDPLDDYLVALHKKNEEMIAGKTGHAPRRPLLLFIQNSNATYTLAKRNDHVIYAVNEGGQCDPFEDGMDGFAMKNHYFTVQNGVACGAHWTDFFTFRYIPEVRDWVFHKRVFEEWVMNNSTEPDADALVLGTRKVTSGLRKKPVRFEQFRPR